MFRYAKVGDRVWNIPMGWGRIIDKSYCHIYVNFNKWNFDTRVSFNFNGTQDSDDYSTLFWDEVKIIPPPKPKRKVKLSWSGKLYVGPKFKVSGGQVNPVGLEWKFVKEGDHEPYLSGGITEIIPLHYEYEVDED